MRFERVVRGIGYTIIALFLLLFFVPFVGLSLYDAIRRNPGALLEFIRLPGCWMIVLGPILFWISLAVFYFRLPKETRVVYVATKYGGGYDIGAIRMLFAEYHRRHGYDWLLWIMSASAAVTLVIIVAIVATTSKR